MIQKISILYPDRIQNIHNISMDMHLRIQISIGYFFSYPWIISGYVWIYIHGYGGAYPLHYFGYIMDILWIYIRGYEGVYPLHYFGYIMDIFGLIVDILWIHIHGYGGVYPLNNFGYIVDITWIF